MGHIDNFPLCELAACGVVFRVSRYSEHGRRRLSSWPTLYRIVLDILKGFRAFRGLTQAALAERLSDVLGKDRLHQTYVSKLERDEHELTMRVFAAYCTVLEIRPSQVMAAAEGIARAEASVGQQTVAGLAKAFAQFDEDNNLWPARGGDDQVWSRFAGSVGPAVECVRRHLLMTQEHVAGELTSYLGKKVRQSYVSAVEGGSKKPSWERLSVFAAVFDRPLSYLMHVTEMYASTYDFTPKDIKRKVKELRANGGLPSKAGLAQHEDRPAKGNIQLTRGGC